MMTEYELIRSFREYLDDTCKDILLPDGHYRSPALVLERVDPTSFRGMFLDYVDAQGIDLDDLE